MAGNRKYPDKKKHALSGDNKPSQGTPGIEIRPHLRQPVRIKGTRMGQDILDGCSKRLGMEAIKTGFGMLMVSHALCNVYCIK